MANDAWNALRADLARGREQAFAELYDRCAGPMFRVARRLLQSDADAEDAVHQAFLDLLRSKRSLARAKNPAAYAVVAARNSALRVRRSADARVALEERVAEEPARETAVSVDDAALHAAMARLSPEQRDVVVLKVDGGLTFDEVGAALSVSPNTAASRYRYALAHLRDALGEEDR